MREKSWLPRILVIAILMMTFIPYSPGAFANTGLAASDTGLFVQFDKEVLKPSDRRVNVSLSLKGDLPRYKGIELEVRHSTDAIQPVGTNQNIVSWSSILGEVQRAETTLAGSSVYGAVWNQILTGSEQQVATFAFEAKPGAEANNVLQVEKAYVLTNGADGYLQKVEIPVSQPQTLKVTPRASDTVAPEVTQFTVNGQATPPVQLNAQTAKPTIQLKVIEEALNLASSFIQVDDTAPISLAEFSQSFDSSTNTHTLSHTLLNALSHGPHLLSLYLVDQSGNETRSGLMVLVDAEVPATQHIIVNQSSLTTVHDSSGKPWFIGPTPIVLLQAKLREALPGETATIPNDGTASSFYKLNERPWTLFTDPIRITDGEHVLRYYSKDPAGNMEAENKNSVTIRYDAPPKFNIDASRWKAYNSEGLEKDWRSLTLGDRLVIQLQASEPNLTLRPYLGTIPLTSYKDKGYGLYEIEYKIRPGDRAVNERFMVLATDRFNQSAMLMSADEVTVDTNLPNAFAYIENMPNINQYYNGTNIPRPVLFTLDGADIQYALGKENATFEYLGSRFAPIPAAQLHSFLTNYTPSVPHVYDIKYRAVSASDIPGMQKELTFRYDAQAPEQPSVASVNPFSSAAGLSVIPESVPNAYKTNAKSVNIIAAVSSPDADLIRLKRGATIIATAKFNGGSYEFRNVSLLREGLNSFNMTVVDLAGNESNPTAFTINRETLTPQFTITEIPGGKLRINSNSEISEILTATPASTFTESVKNTLRTDRSVTIDRPSGKVTIRAKDEFGQVFVGEYHSVGLTGGRDVVEGDAFTVRIPEGAFPAGTTLVVESNETEDLPPGYSPLTSLLSFYFDGLEPEDGTWVDLSMRIPNFFSLGIMPHEIFLLHYSDGRWERESILNREIFYTTGMVFEGTDLIIHFKARKFSGYTFGVEQTAPEIQNLKLNDTSVESVTDSVYVHTNELRLEGSVTESVYMELFRDGETVTERTYMEQGLFTLSSALESLDGQTLNYRLLATDSTSESAEKTFSVYVDNVAPVISILNPEYEAGEINLTSTQLTGNIFNLQVSTRDGSGTVTHAVYNELGQQLGTSSDRAHSFSLSIAEGVNIFTVKSWDPFGNESVQTVTINLSINRFLLLNKPVDSETTSGNVAVEVRTSSPTVTYKVNGQVIGTFDSTSGTVSQFVALQVGSNTIEIEGVTGYETLRLTVIRFETDVPVINTVGVWVGDQQLTAVPRITKSNFEIRGTLGVDGTVTVNHSTDGVTRDGLSFVYPVQVGQENFVPHVYTVSAINTIGQAVPVTEEVYVDTVAPTLSLVSSPATTSASYTLRGNVLDGDIEGTSVQINVNGQSFTKNGIGDFNQSVTLQLGTNHFVIRATDRAGNVKEQNFTVTYAPTAQPDTTAPDITISSATQVRSASYTLTGIVTDNDSHITLTINGVSVPLTNGQFSYAVTLQAGENSFSLIARDSSNNQGTQPFTVTYTPQQGGGGGGGGGGTAPVVPKTPENVHEVKPEDISGKAKDGKVVVSVSKDKDTIDLPANTANLLGSNSLEIQTENGTFAIPSEVLKSLADLLPAEQLKDAKISFKATKLEGTAKNQLLSKAGQNQGAKLNAAGEIFEFELSIINKDGKVTKLSSFAKPIWISFKVNPNANPKLIGIYYLPDNGSLEYLGGQLKDGVISVQVYHFSKYGVLEYNKNYVDVAANYWAAPVIQELSAKHIIKGVSQNEFAPMANVTRAQFATLLVQALGLKASGEAKFSDVPKSAWYAEFVAAANEAGIVSGLDAQTFAPDAEITREQMATMIVRAYEVKTGKKVELQKGTSHFTDQDQMSSWAIPYVNAAAEIEMIKGRSAGVFAPKGLTIRAESAQVIYNLLNK
ncbi:S-layer homology domain-containing protein [Ammoniphilus sp. 3BR4]|uniref:S-layer homology domain-containing protein n=1 Tax=Ammoniphilus sp. 3BR4 TaxID=3158265 RepID=UPI00346520C3